MSHFQLPISVCGLGRFDHFRSLPLVDVIPSVGLQWSPYSDRPVVGFLYQYPRYSVALGSALGRTIALHNDQVHRHWLLRGGVLIWHQLSGETGPCGVEPTFTLCVQRPYMGNLPIVRFAFRYCEPNEFLGFGETVVQRIFRRRPEHESFGLEALGAQWLVGSLRSSYRIPFK
jgi:hypothetical protein